MATIIRDMRNCIQGTGLLRNQNYLKNEYVLGVIRECSHVRVVFGVSEGENTYMKSVQKALECPLLDFELREARMVIMTITGDLDLFEAEKMALHVAEAVGDETDILWELFPENQNDDMVETLIIALK